MQVDLCNYNACFIGDWRNNQALPDSAQLDSVHFRLSKPMLTGMAQAMLGRGGLARNIVLQGERGMAFEERFGGCQVAGWAKQTIIAIIGG